MLKDAFSNDEKGCVDKFSNLKKSVTRRIIPKGVREKLQMFERMLVSIAANPEPATIRVETDYYRNSKELLKSYEKDGNVEVLCAYPQADERKAINAVFDEIIAELKVNSYLMTQRSE